MRTAILLLFLLATGFAGSGYHISKKIAVGGDGGWDYLTVDPDARRVYISHGTEVVVIDAGSSEITGKITGLHGVHGIALAPKLNRGFISNGQSGTVTTFDLKTLEKIGDDIKAVKNPDAILYDPASQRVFAFNGGSSSATAIDARLNRFVANMGLPGKPEFAAADGKGHVYVNIEDKSTLQSLDSKALKLGANWPLAPCEEPSGLAMDPQSRRLFAGCGNNMMAVVNADTGKVVKTVPICSGIDATAFDPGTGLIFDSCGDGTMTVIHEDAPDSYTVVDTVKTQKGSRTMAMDEKTHKLFLPAGEFEPPAPAAEGQRSWPKMVPGSFSVLVLEK